MRIFAHVATKDHESIKAAIVEDKSSFIPFALFDMER